jgi:hypothetical protein
MTLALIGLGIIAVAALVMAQKNAERAKTLEARLTKAEEAVDKFRQLLNEMRGEEEVQRILAEVEELKKQQAAVEPVRHDLSTVSQLLEHTERFQTGSTCLFAADEGLKNPTLHIVHLQNRLGDVEVTREIVHIRFRPSKADQVRSVITKHLPENAAKLYVGKKIEPAADRQLAFVMPTAGMVDSYSDASAEALLELLGVE